MDKEAQEKIYPCDVCGKMRSKDEGGTTFTVCDACWDKLHPQLSKDKPPLLSEKDLYEKYDHPPESDFEICDDCPIATMAMEAQREADIKHYEGK